MSEPKDGICEEWYDIGNRYRPSQLVRCRRKATETIGAEHFCSTHAPGRKKLEENNKAALAIFLLAMQVYP